MKRMLVTVCTVWVLALLSIGTPAPAQEVPLEPDHDIVFQFQRDAMINSHVVTLQGEPIEGGGCRFPMPALTLGPGERIVGSQQVSANYTDCSTVVEIGTPVQEDISNSQSGRTMIESAEPTVRAMTHSLEGGSGHVEATLQVPAAPAYPTRRTTGYYEVEWEDIFQLDTNWVRGWLTWDHNGTKTQAASGWGEFYWLTATGWSRVSWDTYITPYQPQVRWVISDAHFKNTAFCSYIVHNYYDDVTVGGWYDGRLQKRLTSTSSNAGGYLCPPLHWSDRLVRVSG